MLRNIFCLILWNCCLYAADSSSVKEFNFEVKEIVCGDHKVFFAPLKNGKIVSLKIAFKNAGEKLSPKGKEALVALLSRALGEATLKKNRAQILDDFREYNLNFISASTDDDFIISASCPSNQVQKLFELIQEIVFEALFRKRDIERFKKEIAAAMMQAAQMPEVQLSELEKKTLLANHPYGYLMAQYLKSLTEISPADLKNFIEKYFTQSNVYISVCGEIEDDILKKEITAFLKKLPKKFVGTLPENKIITAPYATHHADFPVPQTIIKLVHEGIDMHHPDFFALQIASLCLSDPNVGVLWKKVREDNGLAYYLSTNFVFQDHLHSFNILTATQTPTVDKAINLIKASLSEVLEKGFDEKNFTIMKHYFLGNYKRSFASSEVIATRLSLYQLHDFSKDRYQEVLQKVNALTLDDVNKAFKKFFNPDHVQIFTVGQ